MGFIIFARLFVFNNSYVENSYLVLLHSDSRSVFYCQNRMSKVFYLFLVDIYKKSIKIVLEMLINTAFQAFLISAKVMQTDATLRM